MANAAKLPSLDLIFLRLYRLVYSGSWFVAALVTGAAMARLPNNNPLVAFYVAVIVIYGGNFVLIAVHEFGHAGAAAALGWRVSMIAVGPITAKFRPFSIHWGTPVMGGNLSGGVLPVPTTSTGLRLKSVAVHIGGPLANVVAGCGAIISARVWTAPTVLGAVLYSLGGLSIVMGLANLLPFGWPIGGRSDGGAAYDVLRGQDPEPRAVIFQVSDRHLHGERPRLWPRALVDKLSANLEKTTAGYEYMLLYAYHLDNEELSIARSTLGRALDKFGPLDLLLIEDAFISAFWAQDYAKAEAILARVKSKRDRRSARYFEVQAILAFSKGDMQEGERQIWLAKKALQKVAAATDADWEAIQRIADRFASAPLGVPKLA